MLGQRGEGQPWLLGTEEPHVYSILACGRLHICTTSNVKGVVGDTECWSLGCWRLEWTTADPSTA